MDDDDCVSSANWESRNAHPPFSAQEITNSLAMFPLAELRLDKDDYVSLANWESRIPCFLRKNHLSSVMFSLVTKYLWTLMIEFRRRIVNRAALFFHVGVD